jgi:hypothetical protein
MDLLNKYLIFIIDIQTFWSHTTWTQSCTVRWGRNRTESHCIGSLYPSRTSEGRRRGILIAAPVAVRARAIYWQWAVGSWNLERAPPHPVVHAWLDRDDTLLRSLARRFPLALDRLGGGGACRLAAELGKAGTGGAGSCWHDASRRLSVGVSGKWRPNTAAARNASLKRWQDSTTIGNASVGRDRRRSSGPD